MKTTATQSLGLTPTPAGGGLGWGLPRLYFLSFGTRASPLSLPLPLGEGRGEGFPAFCYHCLSFSKIAGGKRRNASRTKCLTRRALTPALSQREREEEGKPGELRTMGIARAPTPALPQRGREPSRGGAVDVPLDVQRHLSTAPSRASDSDRFLGTPSMRALALDRLGAEGAGCGEAWTQRLSRRALTPALSQREREEERQPGELRAMGIVPPLTPALSQGEREPSGEMP